MTRRQLFKLLLAAPLAALLPKAAKPASSWSFESPTYTVPKRQYWYARLHLVNGGSAVTLFDHDPTHAELLEAFPYYNRGKAWWMEVGPVGPPPKQVALYKWPDELKPDLALNA